MRYLILLLCTLSGAATAADINRVNYITCVSEDATLMGSFRKDTARKASGEVKQRFSEWLFAENFSTYPSRLHFVWTPHGGGPAAIEIVTNEKNHHQVRIHSLRKNNLIVVSNASDPFFNLESWTFAFNFRIESLVATRVQSNVAALKAEVMTYNCSFRTA